MRSLTHLAVRKDADVVAVDGGLNEVLGVLEDLLLRGVGLGLGLGYTRVRVRVGVYEG